MIDYNEIYIFPDNASECIYEECRETFLKKLLIYTPIAAYKDYTDMQNLNTCHFQLQKKYGSDWINQISYINIELKNALNLIFNSNIEDRKKILLSKEKWMKMTKGEN